MKLNFLNQAPKTLYKPGRSPKEILDKSRINQNGGGPSQDEVRQWTGNSLDKKARGRLPRIKPARKV
jgi:hypothetical protein